MKILHTSDWHLGKSLENISRIDEQKEFIQELCAIADEEKIDLVLIAGDIFDTYTPSSAAEELFYDAVDKLCDKGKRAVIVIAGNHDSPERLCAASPLAYKHGIIILGYPSSDAGIFNINSEGIKLLESGPGWLEISLSSCGENAVIITLPYPSESRLEEILSKEADESSMQAAYSDKIGRIFKELSSKFREDTVNLAVSHIFVMGGKESESERPLQVGGAMTVSPEVLPENAHFVALGHLHRPQQVKNAPCPAYYSGSPLAYSFSEADYSKAVYIVEAKPGENAAVREVFLSCGKPLRRWRAENGIEEAVIWCQEGRDINAWVDLEIITDRVLTMGEQKKLRELHPGIVNIRPLLKSESFDPVEYKGREDRRIDELFKEYYRYKMGAEISEEILNTFIDVLNDEASEGKIWGGETDEAAVSGN